jgi:putative hydrolase of the HAD superfamily
MIQAVLFDLYETLISESHLRPTRAGSLGPALGLERNAYRKEWKARRPRIVVGKLSFAEALTEVCDALAGTADKTAIQGICQQRIREKTAACAEAHPQVTTLITELVRRGVRLGVISNGFKEDVLPWPDCSLAAAFHCTAFSCEEGVAKPDPDIYRRALHRLGARPETTVYIGDGGDHELAGAERAGLRAYRAAWFVPAPPVPLPWPELARCQDVLSVVSAG